MALSEDQLKQLAGVLFLLKTPKPTPLPKPANTDTTADPASLASKLKGIPTDAQFKDFGVGVIDFAGGVNSPKVWLNNGNTPWRVASTDKLGILLGLVQLRDDVRKVKDTGIISTAPDFDDLFKTIWKRSSSDVVKKIQRFPPRISTMFDLSMTPPDFLGSNIALDRHMLASLGDLDWPDLKKRTFWERVWLVGAQSDDVCSTSCVSEMGIPYMVAVQRAYGLFDPGHGMHMLLGDGYSPFTKDTPVSTATDAPTFRKPTLQEANKVTDIYFEGATPSKWSVEPGSAAALTAYMLALMQDKLPDKKGCDTLKTVLADETADTTTSLILEGVNDVSTVTKAITKLGILDPTKPQAKRGQVSIRAEFAYIEAAGLKFAVMAAGIQPKKVSGSTVDEATLGEALGKAVFNALKGP